MLVHRETQRFSSNNDCFLPQLKISHGQFEDTVRDNFVIGLCGILIPVFSF